MRQRQFANDLSKSTGFEKNKVSQNNFLIGSHDYLVNNLFDKYYFNQTTTCQNIQAEQVGKIGMIITEKKLGIKAPLQAELSNMKVDLIVSDIDNAQGQIKIHVRVEKKLQVKNKMIVINGYKIV